jgi:DNA polymerase (family 10)
MKLLEATQIANELIGKLRPLCDRVEVAGSIRRGRANVHDIDIVAIPNEEKILAAGYFGRQHLIGSLASSGQPIKSGQAIASFVFNDINVDIYWATHSSWGTLLLIRTGSKQHNIKLCTLAKSRGWQLKASGEGLFDAYKRRIAGNDEEGILTALGLPFLPPGERE